MTELHVIQRTIKCSTISSKYSHIPNHFDYVKQIDNVMDGIDWQRHSLTFDYCAVFLCVYVNVNCDELSYLQPIIIIIIIFQMNKRIPRHNKIHNGWIYIIELQPQTAASGHSTFSIVK